jgi:hypothetical protein
MQPVGPNASNPGMGKCQETRAKCVIWDGPDINCLGVNLCKGQSIDIIIYNTAKTLCEVLEALKIDVVDLSCLASSDFPGTPQNIQELLDLIISKVCNINTRVDALENTSTLPEVITLPDCDAIINDCPSGITLTYVDTNTGATITQLPLVEGVEYLASKICELLCRMSTAESEILSLRTDVDNLMNQVASSVPSVQVNACINGNTGVQPIVDPDFPSVGVIPSMADLICDMKEELVGSNPLSSLINYTGTNLSDCYSILSSLPTLGVYSPVTPSTLAGLGAIDSPTNLQEVLTNLWIGFCDLRRFCESVKANCCPSWCGAELITFDMASSTLDAGREDVKVILVGSFTNYYGAVISANSSIGGPGYVLPPPDGYDITVAYTITLNDQSGNTFTYTGTDLQTDLFTAGSSITIGSLVTTHGFNPVDNYDVQIDTQIVAPDYSTCSLSSSTVIPSICDNQPLVSLVPTYIGYNGVTVTYTTPPPPWYASGTIPTDFFIEILEMPGGTVVDSGNIPYGSYTANQIYIYPTSDDAYAQSGYCNGGCDNLFITDKINPDSDYQVRISIIYNCGQSSATYTSTFTTFVPVEITIEASAADTCVSSGLFNLSPATGTPSGDVSPNFDSNITFDATTQKVITTYAKAGTVFGFSLTTPYIVDTPLQTTGGATTGSCPANPSTRCWGPPSLYKYYPLNTASSVFGDTIRSYSEEGCYDYIDCKLTVDPSLLYTGATSVKNIANTGSNASKPGNASEVYDNLPTVPGYYALTIPSPYTPTTPIKININPALHAMNGGATPTLNIVINDNQSWLANNGLIYFPASGLTPFSFTYNTTTQQWFNAASITPAATTYTSTAWTPSVTAPEGVPSFIEISVYKYAGNGTWSTVAYTYYVTSDWLGLSNITSTGFSMTGAGIGLRDKIKLRWVVGVDNQNPVTNPYYSAAGGPGVGNPTYGKLEISQDPYSGVIGPFVACDHKSQWSYTDAYTGAGPFCTTTYYGVNLWGNTTQAPQNLYNPVGGCAPYNAAQPNKEIEFIMTHDTTITWTLDNVSMTCP